MPSPSQDTSSAYTRAFGACKSYVVRSGHLSPKQKKALVNPSPYLVTKEAEPSLKAWLSDASSRGAVLDIGFGGGEGFLGIARQFPDWKFCGIEVHPPGIARCLIQASQEALHNLKLLREDLWTLLTRKVLPQDRFSHIFLLYPDPWPKKRHHKRRLITPSLLIELHSLLKQGGTLWIKTDHAEYASAIREHLAQTALLFRANLSSEDPIVSHYPSTKYEQRGLAQGRSIHSFLLQKQTTTSLRRDTPASLLQG